MRAHLVAAGHLMAIGGAQEIKINETNLGMHCKHKAEFPTCFFGEIRYSSRNLQWYLRN